MKKRLIGFLTVFSIIFTLASFTAVPVAASSPSEQLTQSIARVASGRTVSREYTLSRIGDKSQYSYSSRSVYLGSQSLGSIAKLIGDELYIPIRQFSGYVTSAAVSYNSRTRTITVVGEGHNLSVSDGAYALYANGRVFFSEKPSVILSNGRMYVPATVVAKAFSLKYSVASDGSARFTGTAAAVESGAEFYDADAVYWLSRIISAESRGESLIGQIAVGNVVLNRVSSPAFPNTIWGVIFDRKYGVQFSPVANGTVYQAPAATSVLAAKICLDGFSVSEEVLYFLRPSASSSSWIVQSRPYLFTIGNHYFFA